MIRAYQAAHGGMVFRQVPTRRARHLRTRLAAVMVIAAVAVAAGLVVQFSLSADTAESARLEASVATFVR